MLGEVKCVWNRARSLITAVLYSTGAILIWLAGQLLCTLRLLYPLSASLARVAFTLPFFIFTILTLAGKYFCFTCLSTVWKFCKLVWDKTFWVIWELGVKLARGLFVVIFFTFWHHDAMVVVYHHRQDSKICRGNLKGMACICRLSQQEQLCCQLESKHHGGIPAWMCTTFSAWFEGYGSILHFCKELVRLPWKDL